jgi:hypothetical protein
MFLFFSVILCFVCLRYVSCVPMFPVSVDCLLVIAFLPLWYLRAPRTDIINSKNNNKKQNKNTTSEQYQNQINGEQIDTLNTHIGSRLLFLFFSVILCFVCLRYVSCVPMFPVSVDCLLVIAFRFSTLV